MITVEKHIGTQRCQRCSTEFTAVSGAILEDQRPLGSYIVGLHGHANEGRLAQMALALLDRRAPEASPIAIALEVSATPRELRMTVVDWADSVWAGETYLGRMVGRVDIVDNPLRPLLLDMADRVLRGLSEVQSYFA